MMPAKAELVVAVGVADVESVEFEVSVAVAEKMAA